MFQSSRSHKSPSYLVQNPYGYYFRIIVPGDLRAIVARRELRYSLKTGRLSEARLRARLMAGLCQQLMSQIRANPTTHGRSDVEFKIQEFLRLVRHGSESLRRSNTSAKVFVAANGIKIQKLIDEFVEENLRTNRWSERTRKDYLSCLYIFIRFFGDVGINSISYQQMREEENDFVFSLTATAPIVVDPTIGWAGAWLGGKYPEGWLVGPEVGVYPGMYINWNTGEPNNDGYVYMRIDSLGNWYDDSATQNWTPDTTWGQGYPDNPHDPVIGYFVEYEGDPVPIPTTIYLLGAGLVGIAGLRRKLKK